MATIDAVGVPRLAGFYRTEEHFIQAKRVGTILFDDHIGINHVEHRLRHLLNGPPADVFTIF